MTAVATGTRETSLGCSAPTNGLEKEATRKALWATASAIEDVAHELAATERMVRMILADDDDLDTAALAILSGLIREQVATLASVGDAAYAACGVARGSPAIGSAQ